MDRLAERQRELRARLPVGLRFEQLTKRDLLAGQVGNLNADRRFAWDSLDEHRLRLHREAEVVGQAGNLAVLDPGIRLELVGGHHGAGMDLGDDAFDGEFAALVLEEPCRVHQLSLIDFLLSLRGVEQRHRREHEARGATFGRGLRDRLAHPRGRCDHGRSVSFNGSGGCRSAEEWRCVGRRTSVSVHAVGDPSQGRSLGEHLRSSRRGTGSVEVLLNNLLSLTLTLAVLPPAAHRTDRACAPSPEMLEQLPKQTSEGKLRRQDDGEEHQRQDEDDRAGPVEIVGELGSEPVSGIPARTEHLSRDVERAEGEAEERRETGEQQEHANEFGVHRVDRPAPEQVPENDDANRGDQVGRVAQRLKRQLG